MDGVCRATLPADFEIGTGTADILPYQFAAAIADIRAARDRRDSRRSISVFILDRHCRLTRPGMVDSVFSLPR